MLLVYVHTQGAREFKKKDGSGVYHKQPVYVYLFDQDGNIQPFPTARMILAPKDSTGRIDPYKPGFYFLQSSGFRIDGFDLKYHDLTAMRPLSELGDYMKNLHQQYSAIAKSAAMPVAHAA